MTFDSFEKKGKNEDMPVNESEQFSVEETAEQKSAAEEGKDATEKIIDLMVEMMKKDSPKGEEIKEAFLRREAAGKIVDTDKFIGQLAEMVKENRGKGEKSHVILATYNRVGRGEFNGKISQPDLDLDILSASFDISPSEKKIREFFKNTRDILEKQLVYMEKGPMVVFYGGSGESFSKAAKTIDGLNSLTELLEEGQKPKFFLLTCRCDFENKVKTTLPLIINKRLEGLIYGKEGDCGGFNDLQKIADSLLKEKEKEVLN